MSDLPYFRRPGMPYEIPAEFKPASTSQKVGGTIFALGAVGGIIYFFTRDRGRGKSPSSDRGVYRR